MRLTHEAQVMPSIGSTISIGRRSGRAVLVGVDILPGSISGGLLGFRPARAARPPRPSQASGSIRGRATHASPAWIAISGGSGCDRKNGIDSVAPYAPTSRIATRSPGSGRAITADCANTSSPEHSGPATVTGNRCASAPAGVAAVPGQRADAMLLADQGRPQHVVDAAVEDHDVLAADLTLRSTTRAT